MENEKLELTQEWDKTFEKSDKVDHKKVTFHNRYGITLAADMYTPKSDIDDATPKNTEQKKLPAIAVSGPFGAVKEQSSGLYAQHMAERGFITIAFDPSFTGESGGQPRRVASPDINTEDFQAAVDFLSVQENVDPEKIGALGICAAGGYTPYAAQTDRRIKAVATVSAADMGLLFREGLGGNSPPEILDQMLAASAEARTAEARGEAPRYMNIVPNSPDEMTDETPDLYREGSNYYRTARAQHPNSKNLCLVQSVDRIAQYSSYDLIGLISPRPILMIAGTKADTRYFSELAIDKASEPKELFLIEGATHIDLYDKPEYVGPAVNKLNTFFTDALRSH